MSSSHKRDPLRRDELELLREVIARRNPELLPLVERIGAGPLTETERNELRGAIGGELADTGYLGTEASNERGKRLDDLIDSLWHV